MGMRIVWSAFFCSVYWKNVVMYEYECLIHLFICFATRNSRKIVIEKIHSILRLWYSFEVLHRKYFSIFSSKLLVIMYVYKQEFSCKKYSDIDTDTVNIFHSIPLAY